jgi:hypothetical protein
VQDNRARGFELGARPSYVLEAFHAFGPGRRLELWHRLSGLAGG